MAKTWKQKLEDKKEPKFKVLQKPMTGVPAGGTLLMPTPQLVKDFVMSLAVGQQVSFKEMREQLAKTHKSDVSYPMSTSTCTRVVAEAAWEEIQSGKDPGEVTPFWRVIEPDSSIAKKLTCGSEFIEAMREQEGVA